MHHSDNRGESINPTPVADKTATRTASSSSRRPHEAIGRANSQSPLCLEHEAKNEARVWGELLLLLLLLLK